jgi:putative intracellular protease/amidase
MRDTVYMLVFDGFADWQTALALYEVHRPGDWQVRTVGFSSRPVLSIGGLQVQPDLTVDQLDPLRAALLIVPGGHRWERGEDAAATIAARRMHIAGAVVAAIGSGTRVLAGAGLLGHGRHAGDDCFDRQRPSYAGAEHYDARALAVCNGGIISARAVGGVEFAREVIRALDLYNASDREYWYRWFKHALPPPWLAPALSVVEAA